MATLYRPPEKISPAEMAWSFAKWLAILEQAKVQVIVDKGAGGKYTIEIDRMLNEGSNQPPIK